MSVIFQRGMATVTLPDPVPGGAVRRERRQAIVRTAGGAVFAYDKGPATTRMELRFESLTDAEKEALQGFFDNEAQGARNTFTYTDSAGAARTARFSTGAIEMVKVCGNVWDVKVLLET